MEIHFGCAQTRASRRMWCLAARGLVKDRAHPGPPTPCCAASECKDTPEVERMSARRGHLGLGHGVAGRCPPSCIRRKGARHAIGQYRGCLAASCQRASTARSGSIQPSPADVDAPAGRAGPEKKKARIHAESGPLRTELGGVRLCAFLSRMQGVVRPMPTAMAGWVERTRGTELLATVH
jgi:hypothetical protein